MAVVHQKQLIKHELVAGDLITIESRILEIREKVLRLYHVMFIAETHKVAATTLITGVHLDSETCKSCPFPRHILDRGHRLITQTHGQPAVPRAALVVAPDLDSWSKDDYGCHGKLEYGFQKSDVLGSRGMGRTSGPLKLLGFRI